MQPEGVPIVPLPSGKRVVDRKALARIRTGVCLVCWKPGTDVHHWLHSRGAGGPDLEWNLVCLCRICHNLAHAGQITKLDLFRVVAAREAEAGRAAPWDQTSSETPAASSPSTAAEGPAPLFGFGVKAATS